MKPTLSRAPGLLWLVVVLLLGHGCGSAKSPVADMKNLKLTDFSFRGVTFSMKKTEVEKLLGPPLEAFVDQDGGETCHYTGLRVSYEKGAISSLGGTSLAVRGQKLPEPISWNDFCQQYGWPDLTRSKFSTMGTPSADLELSVGTLHLTLHNGNIIGYSIARKI
jgi:hypothetical protein